MGKTVQVDVIETWDAFLGLRQAWDAVHARDPEAGYFLSWDWFAEVFRANPGRWRVLAVKPGGSVPDHVCFFPLKLGTRWSSSSQQFTTDLQAGGRLSWGQYTGFVCLPEQEKTAIAAVTAKLTDMPWGRLSHKNDPCRRRLDLFLNGFAESEYRISHGEDIINGGTTDNLICPLIELPDDYESYLQSSLSSNTRQKMRRFWRKFEAADDLMIRNSTAETHERDLTILLDFWFTSWAPARGRSSAERAVQKYREILGQSHALGAVHIPVLWRGDRPLGALANIVDRDKQHLYFIAAGRDETVQDPNVGLLLHAHNIRWAIGNSIRSYDFCHGNEPYKYSFGASDRRVSNVSIYRRSGSGVDRLDPVHIGDALRKAIRLMETDKVDDAAKACRQILPLLAAR